MSSEAPPPTSYHRDVALIHFSALLGKRYQLMFLLSTIWGCVANPWEVEPRVFLSSARLKHVVACRTGRCAAIKKLVKMGAIKKSKATRSGCEYTLLRPAVSELSDELQGQLASMSEKDYRWNPHASRCESTGVEETTREAAPKLERPPTRVRSRKEISRNNKTIGLDFPKLARFVEVMSTPKLKQGSVRYARGAKDVESLGSWFIEQRVLEREFKPLLKLLRRAHPGRPKGDAMRFVFEADTHTKQCYLASILQALREAPKVVQGSSEGEACT